MKHTSYINQQQVGIGLILFSSFLWGTTGTAASFIPGISPFAIGAFSMGFGGVLLAIFAANTIRKDLTVLSRSKGVLVIGALALAIYPMAFYSSMRMSGVAIGTVVSIASAPFFVAILERLYSNEHLMTKRWFISLLIGTTGITLLLLSQHSVERAQSGAGVTLGFLAGLSYAIYACAAKVLINRGVHSKSALGSIFGLGSVILLPPLFVVEIALFSSILSTSVALYMALIPMFLGYVCFGYGLKFVTASTASLITLFEPAVAAIFAVIVVGERIEAVGWIGVGLIMICLLVQSYQPKSQSHLALQSE